jgi:hypothetical protein
MKALSLTQPWATLVALGEKRVETRSWGTNYRGPLAIHAAKGMPLYARDAILTDPFFGVLVRAGVKSYTDLPRGMVVAKCELIDVQEILAWDDTLAVALGKQERAFGDYTPGRFMWFLGDAAALPDPIPARGSLGLWEWVA